ncbi:MAG: PQQ-binding-like beta-propeller repeat protein [Candidatus Bathyarchaeia archaeon]
MEKEIRNFILIVAITILVNAYIAYAQYQWPMFRQNSIRTGYTPSPGPTMNQTLWAYNATYDIWGPSPSVVDGVLYIGLGFGPSVIALNATTGELIWNYTGLTWISSSPAVAYGMIYFGSFDKNVYALNATTGDKIWNYTTGGFMAASSPAVADGVVYIGGGYGNGVFALNATTGDKLWNYTTQGNVHSSPAVANGVVYVGSYDDNVYALNATTGEKIWNYTTGNDVYSSPTVVDGVVYIGSNDFNVYALNATTGEKIWNYTTGFSVVSSPAVVNGVVYVGSWDGNIYALNATTGALIWSYTTGGAISSSPAISSNGIVYIGSGDNKTYALNAQTGDLIWSYETGGDVYSSPAIADGVVYFASRYEGKIYAVCGSHQTFNAVWETQNYPVTIISNSSLSDFTFNQPNKQISFKVVGPKAMSSFCNVTIPKSLLGGSWTVQIDDSDVVPIISENATHTFIYIAYVHESTHTIKIIGSWVVPEFPTAILITLLMIATVLTVLLQKGSRLRKMHTKSRH